MTMWITAHVPGTHSLTDWKTSNRNLILKFLGKGTSRWWSDELNSVMLLRKARWSMPASGNAGLGRLTHGSGLELKFWKSSATQCGWGVGANLKDQGDEEVFWWYFCWPGLIRCLGNCLLKAQPRPSDDFIKKQLSKIPKPSWTASSSPAWRDDCQAQCNDKVKLI